jgi:hypothetical protein
MDPKSFEWARSFLSSPTWKLMIECDSLGNSLHFALPASCPSKGPLTCEDAGPSVDLATHPFVCFEKGTPCLKLLSEEVQGLRTKTKALSRQSVQAKVALPALHTLLGCPIKHLKLLVDPSAKSLKKNFQTVLSRTSPKASRPLGRRVLL